MVTLDGQLQIFMDAYTIESLYVFRGIGTIILVDNPADTDVRAHFEGTGHADGAIAATTPVVVFHQSAMHLHYAAACIDGHGGVDDSIVEGYEERGGLEHRSRLTTEADGIVHHLVVFAITCTLHIHDGLHIARLYLHQDSHAHLSVYLWVFQLLNQGALGNILHTYIDGGYDIATINGCQDGNVEVFLEHLSTMHQSVGTTKLLVEGQFQTVLCTVNLTIEVANGTTGEGGEGLTTGVELLPVEAALIGTLPEDGQHAHLTEGVIVDTTWPDGPVTGTHRTILLYFLLAFEQMGLELSSRFPGEYLVQSVADAVYIRLPDGIVTSHA